MRGTRCIALTLLVIASACGGSATRTSKLTDKARQRMAEKSFAKAVADYDSAIKAESGAHDPALGKERDAAAERYGLSLLADVWRMYYRGDYRSAHKLLAQMDQSGLWRDPKMRKRIARALGDVVAKMWPGEVDVHSRRGHHYYAVLRAESLTRNLPANHVLRTRTAAVTRMAANYHLQRIKQLGSLWGALTFHARLARRFDQPWPNQQNAEQRLRAEPGSAYTWLQLARTTMKGLRTPAVRVWNLLFATENALVVHRQKAGTWDFLATKWFGDKYGISDSAALNAAWTGDLGYTMWPRPVALVLPQPDLVSLSRDRPSRRRKDAHKSNHAIYSTFGNVVEMYYGIWESPLGQVERGHRLGTTVRATEDKKWDITFWFETSKLGGTGGGWGLEWLWIKPLAERFAFVYGGGYLAESRSNLEGDDPVDKRRSLHIPLILRGPVKDWLVLGIEARLNLLQLGGTGEPGERQHFSPIMLRGDIPISGKWFAQLGLTYYAGAETEATLHGFLGYRFAAEPADL